MRHPLRSSAGFTYIAVLVAVVIMGIMAGAIGQSWQMIMKREREEELLFRGSQFRNALYRWHTPRPGGHPPTPLNDLKDLLKDPRSAANVRYLRKEYKDPMSDKDWLVIKDPARGIVGVSSASEEIPLKKDNFPDELMELKGKEKYKDWQFFYSPTRPLTGPVTAAGGGGGVSGIPTSGPGTSGPGPSGPGTSGPGPSGPGPSGPGTSGPGTSGGIQAFPTNPWLRK